ncbi:translation initiation factor eIF4e [Thelephora terrestris]|uniref:Translation initiation factor eIF4e n=1 Tax=Thelephora terrestris TaxID=56493 RepID=A0A9P6L9E5_9AGAM|nr:translation initiation factor eIF4e [Thelephora terrestris]
MQGCSGRTDRCGALVPTLTMSTTDSPEQPKQQRPAGSGRLPSLNQLAARINLNNGASPTPPVNASNRPRLAASVLRTGSTTSVNTVATNDSTAVNVSSTRPASPGSIASVTNSTQGSVTDEAFEAGDDQLTAEKLEELDNDTQDPAPVVPAKKTRVGYKNIPNLETIAARLALSRQLSVDGSSKPPEPETIEDPKTPGLRMKAPEHPLEHPWSLFYDTKNAKMPAPQVSATEGPPSAHFLAPESDEYEAGLMVVGDFDTVETFCRYFNWLKPPSKLEKNSNYHLFKKGIKPMWEDEANANGGKWVLTMKNNPQLLDRCWNWLAMALVGEDLDEGDEICGAVVSLRSKVDRIQLWTRSKDDVEKINSIGKKMVKVLDVSEADSIGFEFQYNSDDRPPPNKFLAIQAVPTSTYRTTFPHSKPHPSGVVESPVSAVPGGAFSHFSSGAMGGAGAGWRGKKA